jgi:hypothetical protein
MMEDLDTVKITLALLTASRKDLNEERDEILEELTKEETKEVVISLCALVGALELVVAESIGTDPETFAEEFNLVTTTFIEQNTQ